MKLIGNFLIAASLLLSAGTATIFTACSDDDKLPAYFKADNREFSLEYDGLNASGIEPSFTLNATGDWRVSQKDEWIHLSREAGTRGEHKIFVTADENLSGESRRGFVEIRLSGADKTELLAVTQNKKVGALTVSPALINVTTLGAPEADENLQVTVDTNSDWTVALSEGCDWIHLGKTAGSAGQAVVTFSVDLNSTGSAREAKIIVTAEANEGAPREGFITITTAHGLVLSAPVAQLSSQALPDSKEVGFVYFSDDFSWVVGGSDQVANINGGAPNDARNIYTWDFAGNGFSDVLSLFNQKYTDYNASAKVVYAMDGYLKFNKGGNQTAIAIKEDLPIENGRYADVEISFLAAKNGTDPMTVTVVIEGDGEIENGLSKTQSQDLAPFNNADKTIPWTWTPLSVKVKGATSNTRIIIGATAFISNGFKSLETYPDNGKTSYFRWFMDDLKVTRIETK